MNSSCFVAFAKATAIVALTLPAGAAETEKAPAKKAAVPEPAASDADQFEGVWSGSWGLMVYTDGVVRPIPAELFIQGDRASGRASPGLASSRAPSASMPAPSRFG